LISRTYLSLIFYASIIELTGDSKIMIVGVSPSTIVVQSPYIAQVQLLREKLQEYPGLCPVEVSTIDSFQGREADAVIISMVSTVACLLSC
jgi:superfamily I DNA and/or RNA helicase